MIDIQNLVIKYGNFTAIHDLSIQIREGEFFTFLGPSGCGKTTTLRAIGGFEKPAGGRITAFGRDLSGMLPEERNIGFVFQNYALFPSMNVYENIAYGLKAHKVPKNQIMEKVNAVAEKTGIAEHLKKKISDLSGGQQQRIAIARALVLEPKILLMDEPLSNLDAKLRVSTREEIKRLQKEFGITTVYVTHDQEEALAISDRIAVFNSGCVEQVGTPQEIYNTPSNGVVARFIGDINVLKGQIREEAVKKLACPETSGLYVRPHKIRMVRETAASPELGTVPDSILLTVTVDTYEFLGVSTKMTVLDREGSRISVLLYDSNTYAEAGNRITIKINLSDIMVLKEE